MRSTLAGGGDSSVALKLCSEQFVVHAAFLCMHTQFGSIDSLYIMPEYT